MRSWRERTCYADMLRPQAHTEHEACHGLQDAFRETTGLPISTYFSAYKWLWLLENVEVVRQAAAEGRCMVGTMDSWLMYNLTGGVHGGHLLHLPGRSGMLRTGAGVNRTPHTLVSCGKMLPECGGGAREESSGVCPAYTPCRCLARHAWARALRSFPARALGVPLLSPPHLPGHTCSSSACSASSAQCSC